ncbi:MAG: ATP-binding protein [Oscillospiraceae bacterium]
MKSIYLRNFTATAVLVLTCFLLVAFACVGIGRIYFIREYQNSMTDSAREVSRTAAAISNTDSLNSWLLSMSISAIARSTGNNIMITDDQGVIVSCSDRAPVCEHLGKIVPPELISSMENRENLVISDLGGIYKSGHYVVTAPINSEEDEEVIGHVLVTSDTDEILGTWSTFLMMASVVAVLVFCLSMIVSLVYSKRMARPLDEMALASRRFARGDFSVRVRQQDDPTDEMGALIESFNKMADSLEKSEKRRSEFIANISHELRTPMTTIAGFADGILDGTIPKEEEEKYLKSIRDETRRLSRLVRDMLSASQAKANASDPKKRTVFDLTELVLQILLSFESRATAKNLDVDPQLPDNHLMVVADKDAITQVIYNLLDNAVKFARVGSCLTLRLYKDGKKAYVSIKDEGETIPPDDLPFIFDRFHKSDRSRSLDKDGVGLGLYLVKSIINSHDEDIAVRSEDGITEFVFTLKLAEK